MRAFAFSAEEASQIGGTEIANGSSQGAKWPKEVTSGKGDGQGRRDSSYPLQRGERPAQSGDIRVQNANLRGAQDSQLQPAALKAGIGTQA